MQNQPNETPKIIGLTVAIVLVLVFAIWQYVRQTQPTPPVANANNGAAGSNLNATGTGTPNVTLASASGNREAGAGQMRHFSEVLDAEPGSVGGTQIQPGRADAFRQFKPPVRRLDPPVRPSFPPPNLNPQWPGGRSGTASPGNPQVTIREIPASEPPMEVKLDGVVLGTPSEAVLTVVDTSVTDKSGGTKTLYLRVGDKINKRVKIIGISEAGIMIEGWSEIWLVGQSRQFGQSQPVTKTEESENTASNLLPSGLLVVPPPSTLNP